MPAPYRSRRRWFAAWVALVAAAGAGHSGTVVELASGPDSAVVPPLIAGDELLSWRSPTTSPVRSGTFGHWGELDLLALVEGPRGPLELELVRDARRLVVRLAPEAWTLKGRPASAGAELVGLVEHLADRDSRPPFAAVESALAGAMPEARAWVWTRFAEAAVRASDWADAHRGYQAAIALVPLPVRADLVRADADVLRRLGDVDDALAAAHRAVELWESIEPAGLGASTALATLGSLHAAQYDLAESQRVQLEVERIRRRLAPRSWLHANALNNLGTVAGRRNDLASAESYLLAALEIHETAGGDITPALANLGVVARLRGDFDRSEMYTRRAIERLRRAGNDREVGAKLLNLANLLGDSGRLDDSIAAAAEALQVLDTLSPDRETLGTLFANRAKVHHLRGDLAAVAADLAAARELLRFERPSTSTEALITSLEAELAEARGDLEEALRLAEITLDARAAIQPDTAFEALAASEVATLFDALGRSAAADGMFRRSIEKLERQQQRLGGGDRGLVAFRGKHAGIYRRYVDFLLRQGRDGDAFELYERSRARALLALLRQRDLDLAAAGVDPALERRRTELAVRIDRGYGALARLAADAGEPRERQRLELEALHAERDALTRQIHAARPRIAAVEAPPALGPAEIHAALPAGTLLLAYGIGPDDSTLFVLGPTGELAVHRLEIGRDELAVDIERWAELVTGTRLRRGELAEIERRLATLLLAPVAAELSTARRLVVVPDGPLHALAFAALPDPRRPERRLLESLPISHQVSASVAARLAARSRPPLSKLAVFADPARSTASVARFRRDFGRLPATRREATRLREIFGERAQLYLDRDATEAAARRALASTSHAHFACHAVVDEALPLDSALLLAPEGGGEGMLQAWEIAEQVELASDLVVLSACETARGAERGGEGILGLVRALQIAGARSVVATLWRVDDDSAAELMARFYRQLADGVDQDESLRRAQLELLRGPVEVERGDAIVRLRTADPRHWAPFVLIGPPR